MATGRRLGQGASLGLVTVSLLLASACSGDSSVEFDPVTNTQDGGNGSGGSDSDRAGNAAKAGTSSGGSGTQAGSGHAGSATAAGTGGSDGGNDTGGSDSGGKGGHPSGGKAGSGGNPNGGKGGTDPSGGKGGTAGGGAGGSAGGGKGGTEAGGAAGGGKGGTDAGGSAGTGGTAGGGTGGKGGSGGSGGADPGSCTSGVFGDSTYYFCGLVDSAALAAQKCESLGMKLVTIQSAEENAYVAGKIKSTAWLGGSDALKEGDWYWLDQTLFTQNNKPVDGVYSNWAEGQPNNNGASGASENCVAILPAGVAVTSAKWNDLACGLTGMRAACEGPQPPR